MKVSKTVLVLLLVVVAALPLFAKKRKDAQSADPAQTVSGTQSADKAGKETGTASGDVVARVGGQPITKQEVDDMIGSRLMQIRQQEYQIRKAAIDQLVIEKLVEKEASSRGIADADLLKAEVEDKIVAPTTADIDAFYESNKGRMNNRTREDAGPDIERVLRQQKMAERRNAFVEGLKTKAAVEIYLDPPRVDVAVPTGAPSRGPAQAPVTIVEFSDYQCGFCKRAYTIVEEVVAQYPEQVRLVYMDYPLPMHNRAAAAAEAAHCAGDQGKFWEYQGNLFTGVGDMSDEDFKKRASTLGLDAAAFSACIESTKHDDAIQAAFDAGSRVGVTGTPTFFVNGRMLVGAKPVEEFKQIIDEEIKRNSGKVQGS